MNLTPRAERLADLSGLAADCSMCFSRARAAGCDNDAIVHTAKAAMRLGAPFNWLYVDASGHPYTEDSDYTGDLESLRAACLRVKREAGDLIREASRVRSEAEAEMSAALACTPPDRGRYDAALRVHCDASCAIEIAYLTARTCDTAATLLLDALIRFSQVYEVPETFVAQGGVLPYDARWIAGETAGRR